MTKFKNIRATRPSGESPILAATRRQWLAGLAGLTLAAWARRDGPALAGSPAAGGSLGGAFTWLTPPTPAPATPITLADGSKTSLRAFRGTVVLLNFWATWCAPCVHEMPSLDRLQARLKGEGLEVVAVSEDVTGMNRVGPFFERLNLRNLTIYLDSDGTLGSAIGISGLPTTLLIDRTGLMLGGMEGPAEWDSDEALALIRHYLEHPQQV